MPTKQLLRPKRYAISYQLDNVQTETYTDMDKVISNLNHQSCGSAVKPFNTLWVIWSLWETEKELRDHILEVMRQDKKKFGPKFLEGNAHLAVSDATRLAMH